MYFSCKPISPESLLRRPMSVKVARFNFMFPPPLSSTLRSIPTHVPWSSVCINWKHRAVLLQWSTPLRGSHFVPPLSGLRKFELGYKCRSREGQGMWSRESAVSFKATTLGEAITDSSGKAGLTSLEGLLLLVKKYSEFRGSMPRLYWDLPNDFILIYKIPFCPNK